METYHIHPSYDVHCSAPHSTPGFLVHLPLFPRSPTDPESAIGFVWPSASGSGIPSMPCRLASRVRCLASVTHFATHFGPGPCIIGIMHRSVVARHLHRVISISDIAIHPISSLFIYLLLTTASADYLHAFCFLCADP